MATVTDRINASARDFRDSVWPLFRDELGGGDLVPVEDVTDSAFAHLLDTHGMTDAWQVVGRDGIRALSTRIQWGPKAWNSWTIRYSLKSGNPTEWHKLTAMGDWHRPSFIIQAYLDRPEGRVISAACIRTVDLQRMIINGWHGVPTKVPGGNELVPVWWEEADKQGIPFIYVGDDI